MNELLTPEFRGGFVSVFRATKPKDSPAETTAKYTIRAFFPPETDLSELVTAADQAVKSYAWKDNVIPKHLRTPFRLNDELETPNPNVGEDWTVMTFSAIESRRPALVDHNLKAIIDETAVYAGAWFRAQIKAYVYDKPGNRGVSFGLHAVQKLRDDVAFTSGSVSSGPVLFTKVDQKADASQAPSGRKKVSLLD